MSISEMMAKDPKPKSEPALSPLPVFDSVELRTLLQAFGKAECQLRSAQSKLASHTVVLASHELQALLDAAKSLAWYEDRLGEADKALMDIRRITGQTHTGQPRAYTALSQIDQIAGKALA